MFPASRPPNARMREKCRRDIREKRECKPFESRSDKAVGAPHLQREKKSAHGNDRRCDGNVRGHEIYGRSDRADIRSGVDRVREGER